MGLFTGSLRRASCVLVGLAALSGLNTPYISFFGTCGQCIEELFGLADVVFLCFVHGRDLREHFCVVGHPVGQRWKRRWGRKATRDKKWALKFFRFPVKGSKVSEVSKCLYSMRVWVWAIVRLCGLFVLIDDHSVGCCLSN